jgi:hypothetical protein
MSEIQTCPWFRHRRLWSAQAGGLQAKGEKAKAEEDFAQAKKLGYLQQPAAPFSLSLPPASQSPVETLPLPYSPVRGLDVPKPLYRFDFQPNEGFVPRSPMQAPPLTPDPPDENRP